MPKETGTTTVSWSGGSPEAYVSRYALRALDVEPGDTIEWRVEDGRLVGEAAE